MVGWTLRKCASPSSTPQVNHVVYIADYARPAQTVGQVGHWPYHFLDLPLFAHCIIFSPFETGDSQRQRLDCSAPSESDEHACTYLSVAMVACNHGNVKTPATTCSSSMEKYLEVDFPDINFGKFK